MITTIEQDLERNMDLSEVEMAESVPPIRYMVRVYSKGNLSIISASMFSTLPAARKYYNRRHGGDFGRK